MKLFTIIRKVLSNPHIYTALIAAGIILGAAWFFKTPENKDYFVILFASVASAQIVISNALAKKKKDSCSIKRKSSPSN
jgi:hypothetical protein